MLVQELPHRSHLLLFNRTMCDRSFDQARARANSRLRVRQTQATTSNKLHFPQRINQSPTHFNLSHQWEATCNNRSSNMPPRPGLGKRPSSNSKEVSPPPSKRRQQSTTTSKAVANFFTPLSKKEPEKMVWRIVKDSLLVGRYGASTAMLGTTKGKRKVAVFDFVSFFIVQ